MELRKCRLNVLPIVMLVLLFSLPTLVESQCVVTNTMSYLTFSPATIFITKTLSAPASCMTTGMNAFGCFPGAAFFNTSMLYATAMSATMNPFCNWVCNCGPGFTSQSFSIDGSDGLPVELMDFAIE